MRKDTEIIIGKLYILDLGASAPIHVIPTEILDNGGVLCKYVNSYAGRVEVLTKNMFRMNGY